MSWPGARGEASSRVLCCEVSKADQDEGSTKRLEVSRLRHWSLAWRRVRVPGGGILRTPLTNHLH